MCIISLHRWIRTLAVKHSSPAQNFFENCFLDPHCLTVQYAKQQSTLYHRIGCLLVYFIACMCGFFLRVDICDGLQDYWYNYQTTQDTMKMYICDGLQEHHHNYKRQRKIFLKTIGFKLFYTLFFCKWKTKKSWSEVKILKCKPKPKQEKNPD